MYYIRIPRSHIGVDNEIHRERNENALMKVQIRIDPYGNSISYDYLLDENTLVTTRI